jgi:quinol monooxygenase YgiN
MAQLTLNGTVRAQSGRGAEMEPLLRAMASTGLSDPGCGHYSIHRSLEDVDLFLMVGFQDSKQAMERVGESDANMELFGQMQPMMDGMPDVQVYEAL